MLDPLQHFFVQSVLGTEIDTKVWLEKHKFPSGEILHRPGGGSMEWKAKELSKMKKRYKKVIAHFGDREDDVTAANLAKVTPILVKENEFTKKTLPK